VEAACGDLDVDAIWPNGKPATSNPVLGNARGMPGAGP
jgi:hypothetical protein